MVQQSAVACLIALASVLAAAPAPFQTPLVNPLERPCAAFWRAATVFVGRVESITRAGGSRRIAFTVVERFRGGAASSLTISVASSAPCAARFRTGREYVVYASPPVEPGADPTIECTRSRDVEEAAADLGYARAVRDGSAPDGGVSGQVLLVEKDLAGKTVRAPRPAPDVTVRLSKGEAEERTVTNGAGDFSFASRGVGVYSIAIEPPPRHFVEGGPSSIELRETRDCASVEMRLSPGGVLGGRVVDSAGQPIAGLAVDVLTPSLAQRKSALTDRDGHYELTRMPAGQFVLGVGNAHPLRGVKPSRVFYPGVNTVASARRVTLAAGETVLLPEFRLPPHLKYLVVSGFVLDADGSPAEGARVFLKGPGEDDRVLGEPVPADFVGRFAVAAMAGAEYAIFAERRRGTRVDSTEPIRLVPTSPQAPITLVLRRRY